MFDKSILVAPSRTEYVTRTVHEHRAPTDQSVALLREMEEAAWDKVIASTKVGDAKFECVVHQMRDYSSDDHVSIAVFSLNGKKFEAWHRCRWEDAKKPETHWVIGLRDAMAKEIVLRLLMDVIK